MTSGKVRLLTSLPCLLEGGGGMGSGRRCPSFALRRASGSCFVLQTEPLKLNHTNANKELTLIPCKASRGMAGQPFFPVQCTSVQ
jgi:hypothetical protein